MVRPHVWGVSLIMALLLGFLLLLPGLGRGDAIAQGLLSSTGGSDVLEFELPATNYETQDSYQPGPIGALFQIVHVFLQGVQPNAFPEGKCRGRERTDQSPRRLTCTHPTPCVRESVF